MMTHRTLGLVIAPLALLLAGWSFWHKAQQPNIRYGFLLTLAIVTGLVTQTADLGARTVFVEGAAVKPAVGVITGAHHRREDTSDRAGHAHDHGSAGEEGHQHTH